MRKDVREQLIAERAAKPQRPSDAQRKRGPRYTGLTRAPKASFCRGCGCVVERQEAYRTAIGIWCPACAATFEHAQVETNGHIDPQPEVTTSVAEESWLRPVGLRPRPKRSRVEHVPSGAPITIPTESEIEAARRALGVRRQRNVPCDQCGSIIHSTPYHLKGGRYCVGCVYSAGLAEERRERSKGDWATDESAPTQYATPKPVVTTIKPGQRFWDWVRNEWREVVTVHSGGQITTRFTAGSWMWNPERAFRFLHGELKDEPQDRPWRQRQPPDYVTAYLEAVA